jgi:hypothetical protein
MYFVIEGTKEQHGASKIKRIEGTLAGRASQGPLWVSRRQTDFIDQWTTYRPGKGHNDMLDISATALTALINPHLELGVEDYEELGRLFRSARHLWRNKKPLRGASRVAMRP